MKLAPGKYVWDSAARDFVPKDEYVRPRTEGPYFRPDLPEYISPVTGKPIDGRAERREDLRKAGARERDPSEFTPTYTSDKHERATHVRSRSYSFGK